MPIREFKTRTGNFVFLNSERGICQEYGFSPGQKIILPGGGKEVEVMGVGTELDIWFRSTKNPEEGVFCFYGFEKKDFKEYGLC